MPVYNCGQYVREAVDSILNQTFADFELIIIDDASTDGTQDIVNSFNDPRIKLIQKPRNSGYTESLNLGIQKAKGEFIARMDGDDISLPFRFEKQLNYLYKHPDIILCSSSYECLNLSKSLILPSDIDKLKILLLEICLITHPAVLMRKWVFDKYNIRYDPSCEPAEDYNLWVDLLKYGNLGNIEEPLIKYRIHNNQTSSLRATIQAQQAQKAQLKMLSYLIDNATVREIELHFALLRNKIHKSYNLKDIEEWTNKLKRKNSHISFFHKEMFISYLDEKFSLYKKRYILNTSNFNLSLLVTFLHPSGKIYKSFSYKEIFKFTIKCLLGKAGVSIITSIKNTLKTFRN